MVLQRYTVVISEEHVRNFTKISPVCIFLSPYSETFVFKIRVRGYIVLR